MSAVQRFAQKSKVIHISKRLTEKAGSLDEKSVWALARVGQAAQFLNQLYELDYNGAPKMKLHGILFADENHKKVRSLIYFLHCGRCLLCFIRPH